MNDIYGRIYGLVDAMLCFSDLEGIPCPTIDKATAERAIARMDSGESIIKAAREILNGTFGKEAPLC